MMILSLALALSLCLQGAEAPHPAHSALGDADAARTFDYCSAPTETPALQTELDAAMDAQSGSLDEEAMAAALLVRAGLMISEAQTDARRCERAFRDGARQFEQALARQSRRLRGQAAQDRSPDIEIAEVQAQIAEHWTADQAARQAYVQLQTDDRSGAAFWAQRLSTAHAVLTDARSTRLMRGLLERYDWIDSARFGTRVGSHAWILVQHADRHPDFQALALERMEAYLGEGGVRLRDYAYLYDRVAVNTGRLQRYGTQPEAECDEAGRLALRPVENPEGLDERRAQMGLGPYQADLDAMAAHRCH
jgi:hypothetical protein